MRSQLRDLRAQDMLTRLRSAVREATKCGIKYDEMIVVEGWELIFSAARKGAKLLVLKHAREVGK